MAKKERMSKEEFREAIERHIGPGWENMTCEEALAWLEAAKQDDEAKQEAEDLAQGILPVRWAQLFAHVARPFKDDTTMEAVMDTLRKKKRPTAKQQEALELFERARVLEVKVANG